MKEKQYYASTSVPKNKRNKYKIQDVNLGIWDKIEIQSVK